MIHSNLTNRGYGSEEDEVTYGYIQDLHGSQSKRASETTSSSSNYNNNSFVINNLLFPNNFNYNIVWCTDI